MIAASAELSSALIALAQRCWEGEHGFHAAAARMADPTLRQLCESYADQRAGFRRELIGELAKLGVSPGPPEAGAETSVQEAPWSSGPEEGVAVAELVRRDGAAEAAYRRLLSCGLTGAATETVDRQHHQLQDAVRHLTLLERTFSPSE
jgi:hypothetical protein